ncbi:MAG: response regulator, partial [Oscillospiraceae bacterium]|nr:response regulator [Oscillospiraceae bacterium]
IFASRIIEWHSDSACQTDPEGSGTIVCDENIQFIEETLSKGSCINSKTKDLPPQARSRLGMSDVLSVFMAPVFVHNEFWGMIRFDDCHSERIFSEDEQTVLRSGSFMIADAIERNQLESLIMKRSAEWEAVMNNYKGVIWSVDKEGTITTFKGRYLEKIGVTPDFLEGKKLELARQKNRHLDIIESVEKTFLEGPQDWTGVIGGDIFSSNTMPIFDEKGQIIGVAGSTDDITETVKLRRELENASRAKGDFLAHMSHEIRTPLGAIIGMTQIGLSAHDIERKDYALNRIDDASDHLIGIVNDILDFSKIEANKLELSSVSFNFEKMLQKTVNVISLRAEEKKQKLYVDIDSRIPGILIGDDQRLAQVITNLLSNAVKFTPEEGVIRLVSRLLSTEQGGLCILQISVADTGIGVTEEQKSRLFNSYEQAETDTSRKFGGTGLGLAISKRIVEMMDGEIWVDSELGKGTTFTLKILLGRDENASIPELAEEIDKSAVRIFAVDGEPEVRDFFTGLSERLGINCVTAGSGREALEILEKDVEYSIYFLAPELTGISGPELARQIRAKSNRAMIVMLLSSVGRSAAEDESKAGFLRKPLFASDVIDLIKEFADIKRDANPDLKKSEETLDFSGHTILLADDIEINREIVTALLEPTRLIVECAENGAQALSMFREAPQKYEMIYMDVQMPEMDGYETTRAIRELDVPEAKTVPIIAMTANVFREDVDKCLAAGMDGHVGKPLDTDILIAQLRRYLHGA